LLEIRRDNRWRKLRIERLVLKYGAKHAIPIRIIGKAFSERLDSYPKIPAKARKVWKASARFRSRSLASALLDVFRGSGYHRVPVKARLNILLFYIIHYTSFTSRLPCDTLILPPKRVPKNVTQCHTVPF
jgi:hypothetical protein